MDRANLNNLLRILKITGGKFILIEDGKPSAVLMDYKEFEDLVTPGVVKNLVGKMSEIEGVNKEIAKAQFQDLRDEVVVSEADLFEENVSPDFDEGITIEPLDRL